jgi:NhaP-type Na+/H+ or K+/H+ antiporter
VGSEAVAHPGLTLTLALAAGVLAQSAASHLRVPGILVLLATGVLLGPDVLGWVHPRSLGAGLFEIVDLGVAVILFEGGLNLKFLRLRRQRGPIRRLVTLGVLISLAGATLAARSAVLFGSLVVVTGPTVVTPLLRQLRLKPRVSTVLEAEGVLIDPIGAILAVLVLEIVLAPKSDVVAGEALALVLRIAFGFTAGTLAGLALAGMLRVRRLVPDGYENIFTLAAVLLLFHGCDAFVSHSGILAVTIAGVWVGNLRTRVDRDLREFKDQLTLLLIGLLFVLLAADVRLDEVRELGWAAGTVIAGLVLVVRPLCVLASTTGSALSKRERLFLAGMAPRGIVAAAIASLTAGLMEQAGLEGGPELRALVFLTIASTVILAGISARPLSTLLGLRLPARETVAILGAQGLGLMLAEEFRKGGVPVTILDSNPQQCRRAEEAGLTVVFGNALEERTLGRARFEQVGTAIGLTANETLNSLFVDHARESFGVPEAYVAVEGLNSGVTAEFLKQHDARPLFEGPHDVERWDVRARHDEIALEHLVFLPGPDNTPTGQAASEATFPGGERCVILSIQRGERIYPMHVDFQYKPDDIATVAIHAPERDQVMKTLEELGWRVQPSVPPEA